MASRYQRERTNPYYLLSAACMLVGCLAQSRALDMKVDDWMPLATLIAVLQVYELLLVGLGVYLIERVGAVRDGTMLLLLEAVFLVDATYLNAEMAASHPEVALSVSSVLFTLAGAKVLVLRRVLGLASPRALVAVLVQLGMLLYMPVVFSVSLAHRVEPLGLLVRGNALPLVALAVWWVLGGMMALSRWASADDTDRPHPVSSALAKAPLVSLVVHLLLLHWTYALPLHPSYLAPFALGLGLVWCPVFSSRMSRELAWLSPVAAILLSLGAPHVLVLDAGLFTVTPFRLALLGAALVFWFQRQVFMEAGFKWAAAASLALGCSGSSPSAILGNWWHIVPQNAGELGPVGILAAFALLGLGFALSVRGSDPPPPRRPTSRPRSRLPSHS